MINKLVHVSKPIPLFQKYRSQHNNCSPINYSQPTLNPAVKLLQPTYYLDVHVTLY